MCLGTVAQVTELTEAGVVVRAGTRVVRASLIAAPGPVQAGDWVLVHSGLVLVRLTEQEAQVALELREPATKGVP